MQPFNKITTNVKQMCEHKGNVVETDQLSKHKNAWNDLLDWFECMWKSLEITLILIAPQKHYEPFIDSNTLWHLLFNKQSNLFVEKCWGNLFFFPNCNMPFMCIYLLKGQERPADWLFASLYPDFMPICCNWIHYISLNKLDLLVLLCALR